VATTLTPVTAPPSRIAASAASTHVGPLGIWIARTSPSPNPRAASAASVRLPRTAALIRAWHDYLPEILPVAAELEAAVITGEDGAEAWDDRMGELREAFRVAVERVDLAPGWTVETAADWAWARCQPSSWRHLVQERGWDPGEYARRTTASVLGEILARNV
jgi:hypothetical protein